MSTTFTSRSRGARVDLPSGAEVQFTDGVAIVTDTKVAGELSKLAGDPALAGLRIRKAEKDTDPLPGTPGLTPGTGDVGSPNKSISGIADKALHELNVGELRTVALDRGLTVAKGTKRTGLLELLGGEIPEDVPSATEQLTGDQVDPDHVDEPVLDAEDPDGTIAAQIKGEE